MMIFNISQNYILPYILISSIYLFLYQQQNHTKISNLTGWLNCNLKANHFKLDLTADLKPNPRFMYLCMNNSEEKSKFSIKTDLIRGKTVYFNARRKETTLKLNLGVEDMFDTKGSLLQFTNKYEGKSELMIYSDKNQTKEAEIDFNWFLDHKRFQSAIKWGTDLQNEYKADLIYSLPTEEGTLTIRY